MKKFKIVFFSFLIIMMIVWTAALLSNVHAHVSNQNTSYSIGFEFEKEKCNHIESEDSPYLVIAIPSPIHHSGIILNNAVSSVVKFTRSKIYSVLNKH